MTSNKKITTHELKKTWENTKLKLVEHINHEVGCIGVEKFVYMISISLVVHVQNTIKQFLATTQDSVGYCLKTEFPIVHVCVWSMN